MDDMNHAETDALALPVPSRRRHRRAVLAVGAGIGALAFWAGLANAATNDVAGDGNTRITFSQLDGGHGGLCDEGGKGGGGGLSSL